MHLKFLKKLLKKLIDLVVAGGDGTVSECAIGLIEVKHRLQYITMWIWKWICLSFQCKIEPI